jgi:hypothetical protein
MRHDGLDVELPDPGFEALDLFGWQRLASPLPLISGEYLDCFAADAGSAFRGITDAPLD